MNKIYSTALSFLLVVFLLLFSAACQKGDEQPAENEVPANRESNQTSLPRNQTDIIAGDLKDGLPVTIYKVTKSYGKPPLQSYGFDLEFKTRRGDYNWVIMPSYLDSPLNENGVFIKDFPAGRDEMEIGGKGFYGDKTRDKAAVIDIYAVQNGFRALRLPARGTVKFKTFSLSSDTDVTELEIWEVRSLLVNGETPLEDWLPYETTSTATKRAFDEKRADWNNLDFYPNSNRQRTDFPKEKVKFIVAKGIRKWKIPFKPLPTD